MENNNNKKHQVFTGRKASKAGSSVHSSSWSHCPPKVCDFASVFPSLKANDDSLWETLPPYFWLRFSCVLLVLLGFSLFMAQARQTAESPWPISFTFCFDVCVTRPQQGCLWELPFLKPDKVCRWEDPGLARLGKNLWSIWDKDGRWPCPSAGVCADGCRET